MEKTFIDLNLTSELAKYELLLEAKLQEYPDGFVFVMDEEIREKITVAILLAFKDGAMMMKDYYENKKDK